MLISLVEWANRHGCADASARNLVRRGKLPQAQKIGRNYLIDDEVPWPDDRRSSRKKGGSSNDK
ncbi:hypothetical protein [Ethanoligenens sp.]|uniref:hypothetical protein n=1 Tax=Ethanoligenens sp. TaxID=2099655 RepID=UPI0039EA2D6E